MGNLPTLCVIHSVVRFVQDDGGSVCAGGEVLAKDGRQLRRPDDHSHDKETTANCLIIRNVFSQVETDSNLNETLAYTVRHPLSLEICRAFLKCSTGPWADTAATVQPHW